MTIAQLIRALGGPQKISDMLGGSVSRQAIYAWSKRGDVPVDRRATLIALAASEGLVIPKELQ